MALLEAWKAHEEKFETPEEVQKVEALKPMRANRRRVEQETGQTIEGQPLLNHSIFSNGCNTKYSYRLGLDFP